MRSFLAVLAFAGAALPVLSVETCREHKRAVSNPPTGQVPAGTTVVDVDFSDFDGSSTVSSFLGKHGLMVSTYGEVASEPSVHSFVGENVDIVDGVLRLKVSATSGTFTTVAKLTPVEGVCAGFFTYTDDNHEIDIEALSSYYTKGYKYSVQPGLEFTNQPLVPGEESNTVTPYVFDPTADYHSYTIEWTAQASKLYVDGELKNTFTENVPQIGAAFIWNSWSSGDPNWSAGPPKQDSYTLIKSVHLEYTTV
ncbi:hypothetical protein JCM10213_004707 [Rhodosporidiobolus nylandii]